MGRIRATPPPVSVSQTQDLPCHLRGL
jgi:hypothetical protein